MAAPNYQTSLRKMGTAESGLACVCVQAVAEFVVGNMLFVLLHETAPTAIAQMGLPVLGKMEDAACFRDQR